MVQSIQFWDLGPIEPHQLKRTLNNKDAIIIKASSEVWYIRTHQKTQKSNQNPKKSCSNKVNAPKLLQVVKTAG